MPCNVVGVLALNIKLLPHITDNRDGRVPGDKGKVGISTFAEFSVCFVRGNVVVGDSLLVADQVLLALKDVVQDLDDADHLFFVALLGRLDLFLVEEMEPHGLLARQS